MTDIDARMQSLAELARLTGWQLTWSLDRDQLDVTTFGGPGKVYLVGEWVLSITGQRDSKRWSVDRLKPDEAIERALNEFFK